MYVYFWELRFETEIVCLTGKWWREISKKLKYNKIQYFSSSVPAMPKPSKRQKLSNFTSYRCRLRHVKPSFRCNFRHFPLVYKAKSNVLQKPFSRSQRQNQPLYRLIWHRNEPFEQDYWDYLSLYVCSWWDLDAYTIPFVMPPLQVLYTSVPNPFQVPS